MTLAHSPRFAPPGALGRGRRGSVKRTVATVVLALATALGCSAGARDGAPKSPLSELRQKAKGSADAELVATWLVGELVSPGGDAARAVEARKALERLPRGGMLPSFARGLDDAAHGRLSTVSNRYLEAVEAARDSSDPRAPLIAWFAAHEAIGYRHASPQLWERSRERVEGLLRTPGGIGWRARLELAEYWGLETQARAVENADRRAAEQHGCVTELRLAGSFGTNMAYDTLRPFAPESSAPWPERWAREPDKGEPPRVLETIARGCVVLADEPVDQGIFYAETFVDVDEPTELLLSAEGAFALWVDDTLVLRRDLSEWGSWVRFGTLVELERGRHRIVFKVAQPSAALRVLYPNGTPYGRKGSRDSSRPYVLAPPRRVRSPNLLEAWVRGGDVKHPATDLVRFVAARLSALDDQADVASVLLEPLVQDPARSTGPVLALAADLVESDPLFADSQERDLVRELMERAAKKDKRLWQPELHLAISRVERTGPVEAVHEVEALVSRFPEVPAVLSQLARLYAELGWKAELARTAHELARRFPDDPNVLEQVVAILDDQGKPAEADRLALRVRDLDPDSELYLSRALERADYRAAIEELRRIGKRRPDRKDIVERIDDVMVRAGNAGETWKKLEAAIEKEPKLEGPRLALADARLARGERHALVRAVVDATEAGAPTERLEAALNLVEGATELAPYRMNSEQVIRDYEASGVSLGGTAARVLDYSAVWVKSDGSSRLLEHEIVRVQSAEAITEMAEEPLRGGLYLKLRVVKKDKSVLEPEYVAGKPTVTMPHLEIGDYIETERIESNPGDGEHGQRYIGPRWFFREENVAYARSEFVVITPSDKPLQVETKNDVPPPEVTQSGPLTVRRWRVDQSPAAPVEPFGAPVTEFLPSVQVGWGITLESNLRAMQKAVDDMTPVDPRIRRIARRIVEPGGPGSPAQRLYRWIVQNVEEGEESDGRRVIVGKNGNLWRGYITLCNALGIPVEYAVVQNRLQLAPSGPFSAAMPYTQPLLRVHEKKGPLWLTLGSKHAPFGYVPAEARGMPAVVLRGDGWEQTRTPAAGALDDAATEGTVALAKDGSATLELVQSFHGKYATGLRSVLSQMPARQIRDAIETRLLGGAIRGVELIEHRIEGLDNPDAPMRIISRSRARAFAQPVGRALVIQPPFVPRLGQYATLPERHTPLLIVESVSQRAKLVIELPDGASLESSLDRREIKDGERTVTVLDRLENGSVILERKVALPAGRVQTSDYAKFLDFTRRSDEALAGSVRINLR